MRYRMPPLLPSAAGGAFLEGVVRRDDGEGAFWVRTVAGGAGREQALTFQDALGRERCTIAAAGHDLQDSMGLTRQGEALARVQKEVLGPLHERYEAQLAGGGQLSAAGRIRQDEYVIRRGRRRVGVVSARWAPAPGGYGVEVAAGEDAALLLAITVCIRLMSRGRHWGAP
jgi:uncharacterized protein YxjI